jgi:hypothetical protein
MYVYAVIWSMEYEGEQLLGVFSDYVKAREFQLAGGIDDNVHIRKVELNCIYEFGGCGEEI